MNIGQKSPLCFDLDNSASLRNKIGSPHQSYSNQLNLQNQKKNLYSVQNNQNIIYSIIQHTKQSKVSDKESYSNMRTTSLQKCFDRSKDLPKDQNFIYKSKKQDQINSQNFIDNLNQYKKAISKYKIRIESSVSKNVSNTDQNVQNKKSSNIEEQEEQYEKVDIQSLIDKKLKFDRFRPQKKALKIQISDLNKEVNQIWDRLKKLKEQMSKQQKITTQSYKRIKSIQRSQNQQIGKQNLKSRRK